MITLDGISKKISGRVLFDDVTISFNAGHRYGLTGPNGAGKSTLLKIMLGLEESTSGRVFLPKKVGFLKQDIEEFKNYTLIDTVIMGNHHLWAALQERDTLYEQPMSDEIGMRLGELEEVIAQEEGYTAEADAAILLEGMGIETSFHTEKMASVPNDWQFRVLLCQSLFGNPEALLLDEPTNHLDLESITWLEDFLAQYKGTLIVISHDRYFLNSVTTDIADIDYDTIILYPGNYDQMVLTKTSVRERAELENKGKEKKIGQLREFVAKFGAGTRASQVQSRVKEIEKLQPHDLKKSNIQRPYVRFVPPETSPGQLIFKVNHLSKSYGEKSVINKLTFDLLRGEKVGVIGSNGRGKTTLLKMLAETLTPDKGSVTKGHNVTVGYFPQEHSEIVDKSSNTTLIDWLYSQKSDTNEQHIRGVLGKMLFSGDDAFKPLKALSGGETARLILAGLMLTEPNTLILDEPNNHLDLEAVSALSWGIEEFKGTAIFASHDRDLISHCATKLIAFEENEIHFFQGTFDEYLQRKKSSV